MSVLRWVIPPVFQFYLGCELILIYTRKFYRPSASAPLCRLFGTVTEIMSDHSIYLRVSVRGLELRFGPEADLAYLAI
jgi:hypothetical protein